MAKNLGVAVDWVDAWGEARSVSMDDLIPVVSAVLGESLDSAGEIGRASDEIAHRRHVVEPVIVAWDGQLPDVEVAATIVDAALVLESGSEVPLQVSSGRVSLSGGLPSGYHQLQINGGTFSSHIIAAPRTAHKAPHGLVGLTSPTYALRADDADVGIGTLRELADLAAFADRVGVSVVGTLPLLAAFPDQPSPYSPASRRAWNEIFIDLTSVPDWNPAVPERSLDPLWVDYDATGRSIHAELGRYADHVERTPGLRASVAAYTKCNPEISRYAHFRALTDAHGRNWRGWSDALRPDPERVNYHATVQWIMDEQLASLSSAMRDRGQYLYLDLPIGCHPDGYDIWDNPNLFADASLGAPPDTLFVGGQDWGLPASIPSVSRASGHANFRKAIAKQFSVAGLLRIDHVMGMHRTWWVPHGAAATDGAYVMQPSDEMFAIIAIESVRARCGVVGENLGTVPPEVGSALDAHRLLGMVVAPDGALEPDSEDLVAMTSHDTPSFAAWWKELDIFDLTDLGVFDADRSRAESNARQEAIAVVRQRFGTSTVRETSDAVMEWMVCSDAAIALLNIDDLLMEERRQNVPGTYRERPNWRLRYTHTLEEIIADESLVHALEQLSALRDASSSRSHRNGLQ
ncbi:MAG: 4-alpha-glucanotransferase [Actinomycetia bacterium]|nr:4-alpha-glucanotransferase [Actinomycetes bacterium]